MGVAALNSTSEFAQAYEKGIKKTEYWRPALEDSLTLIARLPTLAARIYKNVYKKGEKVPAVNKDLDLVGRHIRWSLCICMFLMNTSRKLREHARLW